MDEKDILARYLRAAREGLVWKTEGLSERDLRLPRTSTGTSLLGLVKHCAGVEAEYFGACLGREHGITFPAYDFEDDPNGDLYATADETAAEIVERYRRVGAYVDATIAELPLDAPARVPWWGDAGETTFRRLLVHPCREAPGHRGRVQRILMP